jgi:hypothetical protein
MKRNRKNTTPKMTPKWSPSDRQAFADGNILKAKRMPNAKAVANRRACKDRTSWV